MTLLETIMTPSEPPSKWDEATVTALKDLWASGWSGSDIAHRLGNGHTRNSVIGKVHRLGLAARRRRGPRLREINSVPRREVKVKRQKAQVPVRVKTPPLLRAVPVAPAPPMPLSGSGVALAALTDHHCRWPLWENDTPVAEKLFCGAEPAGHSRYCAGHVALSHRQIGSVQ